MECSLVNFILFGYHLQAKSFSRYMKIMKSTSSENNVVSPVLMATFHKLCEFSVKLNSITKLGVNQKMFCQTFLYSFLTINEKQKNSEFQISTATA